MTELKNKDITEKIMGASFEVHKFLGNAFLPARQGFQEAIYQWALAWELSNAGLSFAKEIKQEIFYPSQGTTFTIQLPV
jgi:GxxExxY protein